MGRIVVGVDGSKDSEAALFWAAAEARLRGGALTIVHALYTPVATVPFGAGVILPPTDELSKYGEDLLDVSRSMVQADPPDLDIDTDLLVESPVVALLQAAEDADLMVVGSRGLGAMGAAFLGSVSTRVAARSVCPTVVVRTDRARPADSGPVVVGVDGSAHGDAALRFALAEADRRGAGVVAVYSYHVPITALPMDPADVTVSHAAEREAAERHANEIVQRQRAEMPAGVEVTVQVTTIHPAEALATASQDAGLTVVGSRGRGAFRGMVLGSVSQRLLHHAHSPVAVVHHAGHGEDEGADTST